MDIKGKVVSTLWAHAAQAGIAPARQWIIPKPHLDLSRELKFFHITECAVRSEL